MVVLILWVRSGRRRSSGSCRLERGYGLLSQKVLMCMVMNILSPGMVLLGTGIGCRRVVLGVGLLHREQMVRYLG